jgi:hypothetical protein
MQRFELAEELLSRPGSPLARIFKSLPDAFAGIGARSDIQEALIRFCILDDCGGLPVDRKDHWPLALF